LFLRQPICALRITLNVQRQRLTPLVFLKDLPCHASDDVTFLCEMFFSGVFAGCGKSVGDLEGVYRYLSHNPDDVLQGMPIQLMRMPGK
jgi:hypothetical protein